MKRYTSALIAAIAVAAISSAAPFITRIARGSEAAATAPAPAATESAVQIDNFMFKPKELSVAVGTKVTWVNKDDVPHTATSSDEPAAFDSKTLDTDQTYSFTFTKPGTYTYFCKVHPHMKGVVTVK